MNLIESDGLGSVSIARRMIWSKWMQMVESVYRLYLLMMNATFKKFRSRSDHHSNGMARAICGGE